MFLTNQLVSSVCFMADEPATEILDGAYRALCRHGYANLTLQDIAAEADTSKASIYYHFDSKHRVFAALLDKFFDRFTDRINSVEGDTPREQLDTLLQELLATDTDPAQREFRLVLLELKAQAPYNSVLQEHLTEFDEFLSEQLQEILAAGINSGEFEETIDPVSVAELLTTTICGAQTCHVVTNHSTDRIYTTMSRYIERQLLDNDHTQIAL